jgi:hypothetical protein
VNLLDRLFQSSTIADVAEPSFESDQRAFAGSLGIPYRHGRDWIYRLPTMAMVFQQRGEYYDVGDWQIPRRFWFALTPGRGPWRVLLVRIDDYGALVCDELRIIARDGKPLRATHVRDTKIDTILRETVAPYAWQRKQEDKPGPKTGAQGRWTEPHAALGSPELRAELAAAAVPLPRRGGRLSPEHLRAVARTYTAARGRGESAMAAIEKVHHTSRSNAGKLVWAARRRTDPKTGVTYLPPTTMGVARAAIPEPQETKPKGGKSRGK